MLATSGTSKEKQQCVQTAIGNLKSTIKQQYKQISAMLAAIDQLATCREKTKSPVVMDAIDQVIKSSESLKSTTTSVHSAFYEAEKAAIRGSSDQKTITAEIVPALEENRAAINKIRSMIEKQGEALGELAQQLQQQQQRNLQDVLSADQPTSPKAPKGPQRKQRKQTFAEAAQKKDILPQQGQPQDEPSCSSHASNGNPPASEWKTVRNSRKNNRRPSEEKKVTKNKKRQKPPPPDAIAVKPGEGESAAEILKSIQQNVEIDKIDALVSTITESRTGEIIIRLTYKDTKRGALEEELRNKLGTRAAVRGLIKLEDVEIQDLDLVTTVTEVEVCIRNAVGAPVDDQYVKVKSIKQSFMGTQRATVKMKSTDARKLTETGRIKIGWV